MDALHHALGARSLLDTDVVSELRKVKAGKAHPNVAAWSATVAPTETLPRMN